MPQAAVPFVADTFYLFDSAANNVYRFGQAFRAAVSMASKPRTDSAAVVNASGGNVFRGGVRLGTDIPIVRFDI